ncbi:hypothetical protein BV22DRAFT_423244 [Leucogyrophana mollusca]|uniref:Uncharacterized protein n=1 Tax=Leucogyrophana mollusca TaxID=85980 RepID=A0ACB8BI85_9AGAM|nr:hypothetical protein BV22DRAFT_423244 [Leucogyrophana mollusca]
MRSRFTQNLIAEANMRRSQTGASAAAKTLKIRSSGMSKHSSFPPHIPYTQSRFIPRKTVKVTTSVHRLALGEIPTSAQQPRPCSHSKLISSRSMSIVCSTSHCVALDLVGLSRLR